MSMMWRKVVLHVIIIIRTHDAWTNMRRVRERKEEGTKDEVE